MVKRLITTPIKTNTYILDKPSENSPQQNLCSSTSYSLKIEAGSPQTQSLKYLSPTDEGYLQDEDQNLISSQTEDYGYP